MDNKFVTIVRVSVTPRPDAVKPYDADRITAILLDALDTIQPDPEVNDALIEWDFETFEVQEFPETKENRH